MNKKKRFILFCVALSILGSAVYLNSISVPFHYDGQWSIVNNVKLYSTSGIISIFLHFNRALTYLTFAINIFLGGTNVTGFHIFNIALHILNSAVLFLFLRETTKSYYAGKWFSRNSEKISISAALLFLVHPIHTETVSYIYQRSTALVFLFYLLSLLTYSHARKKKSFLLYTLFSLFSLAAIMSKPNAAMLPLFVLAYELYFFRNLKISRKITALLVLCLVFLIIFPFMLEGDFLSSWQNMYEKRGFTPTERLLTQPRVVLHYISLLVFPSPDRLRFDYDIPLSTSPVKPLSTLLAILIIAFTISFAVIKAKKYRILSFSIIWYFGNLIIESSLIPLIMVFEHRTYLPSVFFFLLISAGIVRAGEAVSNKLPLSKTKFFRIDYAVIIILLTTLSMWTIERNKIWQSGKSLWQDTVEKSPGSYRAHIMLGQIYYSENNLPAAISEAEKALELNPSSCRAFYNLGVAILMSGNTAKAREMLLSGPERFPDCSDAYEGYGIIMLLDGRFHDAIPPLLRATEIRTVSSPETLSNIGVAYWKTGNITEAEKYLTHALTIAPNLPQAKAAISALRAEKHLRKYN